MTVTAAASGTASPTVGTAVTLSGGAVTVAGTYVLKVDLANMVLGDQVTLTASVAAKSGGTQRLLYQATYRHVQAIPIKVSPPVTSPLTAPGVTFQLTQDTGTARTFDWAIELLG